jgi:hypothetical protein
MRIGIYDQTGRLVKGELGGYERLAMSRDAAISLYYVEVKGREVIMCSRINVKKPGERRDRFIVICKTEMRKIKEQTSKFFKSCVDTLEKEGYEIIGCLKEGDILRLTKAEETGRQFGGLLESAVGKVVFGEKVTVRASNPVDSVSFIVEVIRELEHILHLGFIFEISETPSTSNMNIIPEVKKWDVDLDEHSLGKTGADMNYYEGYKNIKGSELESIQNKEELKEKIVSQEWVIGVNRALRDKDKNQVKKLYEEKRKEFIEKLVNFSDRIGWVINEIGDDPNPPRIKGEVAAKLIEEALDSADTRGENFLIKLYNPLRLDKDHLWKFLYRIINEFGDRIRSLPNLRRKIEEDVFESEDDVLVRNLIVKCGFIPRGAKIINRISKLGTRIEEKIAPDSAVRIICSIANNNIDEVDEYGAIFLAKLYKRIQRNSSSVDDLHSQINYRNIISSKHPNLKFAIVDDAIKLEKLNREKLDTLGFMKEYQNIKDALESTPMKKQTFTEEKYTGLNEPSVTVGAWREEKKRKKRARIKQITMLSVVVIVSILAVLFLPSFLSSFLPSHQDTIPLTILSTNPQSGANNVPITTNITTHFNEPMNDSTLIQTKIIVVNSSGSSVHGDILYNDATYNLTFDPIVSLAYSEKYHVTITMDAKNLAGNGLNYSWEFRTWSAELNV